MPVRPAVAIVGRPNVGKSTLFNRLAGQRLAVVDASPGTTRDRLVAPVDWVDTPFVLVDTGGLSLEGDEHLGPQVRRQVGAALAEADLIIHLTDGSTGLHPGDAEIANLLRRQNKPVVLVVNKCENVARELGSTEFYRLGLGDPFPISAISNIGIGEMLEQVVHRLPPGDPDDLEESSILKLALVGRPNVGKSSLLNAIVGSERAIVDEMPGTTRDAVDISATYRGRPLILIDTAGIRRRGHITPGVEQYSALRTFQAIQRSNVSILVLDATEMVTAQDTHIAGDVSEAYSGLVIAINKWDLARERGLTPTHALGLVRRRFKWAPYAPVRFTAAITGHGVRELLDVALEIHQERQKHVGQGALNRLLIEAMATHPPPSRGSRRLRILKVVQTSTNPPTFVFHVNDPKLLHFSYERFLQNTLRSELGFHGSLLRFEFRKVARRWGNPEVSGSPTNEDSV